MDLAATLVEELARQLVQVQGPTVALVSQQSLAGLQQRVPGLLGVFEAAPARQTRQSDDRGRLLRADPRRLPLQLGSLQALLAVSLLSRYADCGELLQAWSRHLTAGGQLFIVEPLIRSATMRRLRKLVGGPRHARAPEEITSLLLNSGYGEISQQLVGDRGAVIISSGRLRTL